MRVTVSTTVLIGVLLSASCVSTDSPPATSGLRPAQRHAIHSESLRQMMTGLNVRAAKTWPQEIEAERQGDAERDREARLNEARQLAATLADAAGQIPSAVADVDLTDVERDAFMAEVSRLRSQARQLESSVADRDLDRMRTILRSIRATCNHCHGQFRELAGSVDAGLLYVAAR
jgi:cytochrome c556